MQAAAQLLPAVATLFGSKKEKPPEQKVAPVPDDEATRKATARQLQRRYAGQGRAGTVLQGSDNKLG